jgi:hypothetical protein
LLTDTSSYTENQTQGFGIVRWHDPHVANLSR